MQARGIDPLRMRDEDEDEEIGGAPDEPPADGDAR
jgi:hypothetical protein